MTINIPVFDSPVLSVAIVLFAIMLLVWVWKFVLSLVVGG